MPSSKFSFDKTSSFPSGQSGGKFEGGAEGDDDGDTLGVSVVGAIVGAVVTGALEGGRLGTSDADGFIENDMIGTKSSARITLLTFSS